MQTLSDLAFNDSDACYLLDGIFNLEDRGKKKNIHSL